MHEIQAHRSLVKYSVQHMNPKQVCGKMKCWEETLKICNCVPVHIFYYVPFSIIMCIFLMQYCSNGNIIMDLEYRIKDETPPPPPSYPPTLKLLTVLS